MSSITIHVSDERAQQLSELAIKLHVSPEDLLQASLDELISRPDVEFQKALIQVIAKNTELYKRLA